MHPWRGRVAVLVLAACAWLAWVVIAPNSLTQLDERSSDFVWRLTASAQPERRVILVDIDDSSLTRIGAWPWSREAIAELTSQLDQQGVGLKLFDIVFPDSRAGGEALTRALRARDAEAPSLLAQVFALRNESQLQSGVLAGALPGAGCQAPAVAAQGFIGNAGGLHSRAGHITPVLDADGAVRRLPGFVCFGDRTYPSLVLAGLSALGAPLAAGQLPPEASLLAVPGAGLWQPAWQLALPGLGSRVPMDAKGHIRVPYRISREAMAAVSAADVMEGRVPAGMLKGAVVVIGASAFGLADIVPTALGSAVSGSEVHAQLFAAALDDAVPYTPQGAVWLQLAFAAFAVLALLKLAGNRGLRQYRAVVLLPVLAVVLAAMAFVLQAILLVNSALFVGWAAPALAVGLAGLGLALAEHARSLAEKSLVYRNLSSYVSSPVAEQIALTEPTGNIEANRDDVTVLVADLQNFSRYCEARSPEDAARVLHRFFITAETVIGEHGGVVREMVGDNLLAVFNGPLACTDHPAKALAASRELWLRCTEELPNTTGTGLEPLSVCIGIESGMALVGSFGPARRRVHAVLGIPVTVAVGLRDMTADLAYPVLIGQEAAERCLHAVQPAQGPDIAVKTLGSFLLPGLQRSCKVFTLRTLLQPGGAAEQSNLLYLHQLQKNSAA
ncbi:MAG: cyaA [Polaromonas sp.]|nr:cyaA [Polaromonas sp.]